MESTNSCSSKVWGARSTISLNYFHFLLLRISADTVTWLMLDHGNLLTVYLLESGSVDTLEGKNSLPRYAQIKHYMVVIAFNGKVSAEVRRTRRIVASVPELDYKTTCTTVTESWTEPPVSSTSLCTNAVAAAGLGRR